MKAIITRDSVCAADDFNAPHARHVHLPDDMTIGQLLLAVVAAADLPSIAGGQGTWCVSSRVPLAVVAQEWPEPRLVGLRALSDLDVSERAIRLHFSYFAQLAPDAVYEVLVRLRLRAD